MQYQCIEHRSADEFLNHARDWLMQYEAEHNLILGIADLLRTHPVENPFLITMERDGQVVGCAFRTPPNKMSVTRMPDGAALILGQRVVEVFDDAPSVLGPETTATTIAKIIADARGKRIELGKPQRIYELHNVDFPKNPAPGRLRLAQNSDIDLIGNWLNEFARETDHGPGDTRTYALAHIAGKTLFVWEDEGEPRTTVLWAAKTPHGVRIGFVFTPQPYRGKGYASICVAEASQRALNAGYSFCCLYTDLTNATSNDIYQKIGYRPVADVYDVNVIS